MMSVINLMTKKSMIIDYYQQIINKDGMSGSLDLGWTYLNKMVEVAYKLRDKKKIF